MKISKNKQDFLKVWMKCLEIATSQDFAPNTLELLAELHLAKRSALLAMRVEEPPSGSSCLYGPATNQSITHFADKRNKREHLSVLPFLGMPHSLILQ